MARRKVGILISGRGSNMAALIAAAKAADYPAEIAIVISNRASAAGLDLAAEAGVATAVIDHREFADRESFDRAVSARLTEAGADIVCLAGFMRLLSPWFAEHWHERLLNIHPSLLPLFKGLDTHQRALDAGVRIHGCTVHFVTPELDAGPIIAQAAVPVLGSDDAETLAARVLVQEHVLYPLALKLVAAGRTRIVGERVVIDVEGDVGPEVLIVPKR